MGMRLAIDVGNTRTKVGEFQGNELLKTHYFTNDEVLKNSLMLDELNLEGLIISSVNQKVSKALPLKDKPYPCLILDQHTPLPIKLRYESKDTLGKDRIALAVGASACFPAQDVLAIDVGTCITYDLVNKEQEYLGGAISPGIQLRLKSLHTGTASLPLIDWQAQAGKSISFLGKSTMASMISGVVNGINGEIQSFINTYRNTYDNLTVIISGGDASFFEKELKNGIFADPNLVLKGLNEILLYNLHT